MDSTTRSKACGRRWQDYVRVILLLAVGLGSLPAQAQGDAIKGMPRKLLPAKLDISVNRFMLKGGSLMAGLPPRFIDIRDPFDPGSYKSLPFKCEAKVTNQGYVAKPSDTFATKIEIHKMDGNGNGVKVAEHYQQYPLSTYGAPYYYRLHEFVWHPKQTGRYLATCIVDAQYKVHESDEHNNRVGQGTAIVLYTGVPANAFKIRIVTPSQGYVADYPSADPVQLSIAPVEPDWRPEHVYMDVLKWDRQQAKWVNLGVLFNDQWSGSLSSQSMFQHGKGLYMVRAQSRNRGVVKTTDSYEYWAEPVKFWVGKPLVDADPKTKTTLPQGVGLQPGTPLKPMEQKSMPPTGTVKLPGAGTQSNPSQVRSAQPSQGGSGAETPTPAQRGISETLRHRNRAVTPQDSK